MTRTFLSLGSALVLLAGVAGANAATTPATDAGAVVQNSQAVAAADQMPAMNMRQQLQDQMTKAGYTDVMVTPSSFYVHAKNKQGDPVAMVIGPEGFTEVTEIPVKASAGSGTNSANPAGTVSDTPAPTPVPVPPLKK